MVLVEAVENMRLPDGTNETLFDLLGTVISTSRKESMCEILGQKIRAMAAEFHGSHTDKEKLYRILENLITDESCSVRRLAGECAFFLPVKYADQVISPAKDPIKNENLLKGLVGGWLKLLDSGIAEKTMLELLSQRKISVVRAKIRTGLDLRGSAMLAQFSGKRFKGNDVYLYDVSAELVANAKSIIELVFLGYENPNAVVFFCSRKKLGPEFVKAIGELNVTKAEKNIFSSRIFIEPRVIADNG